MEANGPFVSAMTIAPLIKITSINGTPCTSNGPTLTVSVFSLALATGFRNDDNVHASCQKLRGDYGDSLCQREIKAER